MEVEVVGIFRVLSIPILSDGADGILYVGIIYERFLNLSFLTVLGSSRTRTLYCITYYTNQIYY